MTAFDDEKWRKAAFNVVVVFGFLIRGDDILLIRRANEPFKGMITVPGGRKERGETAREACVREMREETGYAMGGLIEFVGTLQAFSRESSYDFISYYYMSRDFSGALTPSAEGDLLWMPMKESLALDGIHPYYVAVMEKILSRAYPFDASVRTNDADEPLFTF